MLRRLPVIVAPLIACAIACSASVEDDSAMGASAQSQSDAGPDGDTEVPAYASAEPKAQLRWTLGSSAVAESLQTKLTIDREGQRRFKLEGAIAADTTGSGRRLYIEFGSGAAYVAPGTYSCEALQAAVVVFQQDDSKLMTPLEGGATRACTVTIDQAAEQVGTPAWQQANLNRDTLSWRPVTGRVEAEVGPRADPTVPASTLRASFAAIFDERRTPF
jgi:hypothetical protein